MRVRQLFGREAAVLLLYGWCSHRNSFYAEVCSFGRRGVMDLVDEIGAEEPVVCAADIAAFLAPWADLEPVYVRELERDRVLARKADPFTR